MLVVFAIFFAIFGGSDVSLDGGLSGERGMGRAITAPPAARSTGVLTDGGSGGPSLIPPTAIPSADGGSGGPSFHP